MASWGAVFTSGGAPGFLFDFGLWVFPRGFGILSWWLLASFAWTAARGRWRAGVTAFSSVGLAWLGGRPLWGVGALAAVAFLHWLLPRLGGVSGSHEPGSGGSPGSGGDLSFGEGFGRDRGEGSGGGRGLAAFFLAAAALLLLGHVPVLLVSLPPGAVLDGRLSLHLLALFFGFRVLSYGVAVAFRGERPGFFLALDYFLAPPFWLEPMKGTQLTFATFAPEAGQGRWRGLWWIARGAVHGGVFALFGPVLMARLRNAYATGGPGGWGWWLETGALVFLLGYLEKSRMSYLLAGFLRLGGRAVEPDFRSPLLAKSLLEYWRRFHYWVLEFYLEVIYQPLAYFLARRLPVSQAVAAALFLSFAVGTSVSHWVHYPAEARVAAGLGLLFAALTLLHFLVVRVVRRMPWLLRYSWAGVPFTWVSVAVLYVLAYPAFGLGWSLENFSAFFWRAE